MKKTLIPILFLISTFIIGCISNEEVAWGNSNEMEVHIQLLEYKIYNDGYINSTLIDINITLKNICKKDIYVPKLLIFDINVDGVIVDSNNNTYFLNRFFGGYPEPEWKEKYLLFPNHEIHYSEYLGVYSNENTSFPEDRLLLPPDEEFLIKCWYDMNDIKIDSNLIAFNSMVNETV